MTTDVKSVEQVSIPRDLAVQVQRLLDLYALPDTYTHRPRTGGVLQGCPRGPQITPAQLALRVRIVRDTWKKEVSL